MSLCALCGEREKMLDAKLDAIEQRYIQLEEQMGDPDLATDHRRLTELGKERAELTDLVELYRRYKEVNRQLADTETMLSQDGSDPELAEMVRAELEDLRAQRHERMEEIKRCSSPATPTTTRTSSSRSAPARAATRPPSSPPSCTACTPATPRSSRWKIEVLSSNARPTAAAFREIIFEVKRPRRLQPLQVRERRPPRPARAGHRGARAASTPPPPPSPSCPRPRRSTSRSTRTTCKIDIYRSGGARRPERQHDRLRRAHDPHPDRHRRHLPGRAIQLKNRIKAMTVLRSRLYEMEQEQAAAGAGRRAPLPGRQRRARREDPHLQLPPGPRHRPPHQAHRLQRAPLPAKATSTTSSRPCASPTRPNASSAKVSTAPTKIR